MSAAMLQVFAYICLEKENYWLRLCVKKRKLFSCIGISVPLHSIKVCFHLVQSAPWFVTLAQVITYIASSNIPHYRTTPSGWDLKEKMSSLVNEMIWWKPFVGVVNSYLQLSASLSVNQAAKTLLRITFSNVSLWTLEQL